MEFLLIKGDSFIMGDVFVEGWEDEKPTHKVDVNDFYLGKSVVTQGQWEKLMGSNPSRFQGFVPL